MSIQLGQTAPDLQQDATKGRTTEPGETARPKPEFDRRDEGRRPQRGHRQDP